MARRGGTQRRMAAAVAEGDGRWRRLVASPHEPMGLVDVGVHGAAAGQTPGARDGRWPRQ